MTDRIRLDEAIAAMGIDEGRVDPAGYPCPSCNRVLPVWAMGVTTDEHETVTCTDCEIDRIREEKVAAEAAAPRDTSWSSDAGLNVKAERNRRIETARWAVDPITSPLTVECQAAWADYIRALNRLSVDYPSPGEVVWPIEPELAYPAP